MQPVKKRFAWPLVAAVIIAGTSALGTLEWSRGAVAAAAPAQTARPTPAPQTDTVAPASDLSRAFRAVHSALKDAVVNINVVKHAEPGVRRRMQIPEQFRDMLPPGMDPDQLGGEEPEMQGTGSGVIVSADGYILTNNHVVSGANDIKVTLNDGRELKAELVGTDPKTDLAVVRVKADHLTFAKFGDSEVLDVGDWVLAFGSPFGFSQTMTQGIISAKGRHVPIIAEHDPNLKGLTYENFLQTDAAINPGNSGGPLVNLKGEVVGINAAIASSSGGYNGIGFSIPSNDAQYIMKSLIEHGKVVRGYLGVMIEDFDHPIPHDKPLADSIRKQGFNEKGILVSEVTVNGPGAAAGLQSGDVITAVNGKAVTSVDDLRNQIARTSPEAKINLTLYRDGKSQPLAVAVGTQPDTNEVSFTKNDASSPSMNSKDLGVTAEELSANQARRYGLKAGNGVIISKVAPDTLAAESGLKPGDVITRVDKTPITSTKQLSESLSAANLSKGVKLFVRTDDGMDRMVYVEKN